MMKMIGAMQVGGHCEWVFPKILKGLSSIVDEIVVVGSGRVSDEIIMTVKEISNVVEFFLPKGMSKRIEWDDMNMLLKMALARGADWILFQDSHETFGPKLNGEIREMIKSEGVGMFRFRKYWLWKDDLHYRVNRSDKFLPSAVNTYLVRASPDLRFPNPAGPLWKRLKKSSSYS